jgi:hypothetical protein
LDHVQSIKEANEQKPRDELSTIEMSGYGWVPGEFQLGKFKGRRERHTNELHFLLHFRTCIVEKGDVRRGKRGEGFLTDNAHSLLRYFVRSQEAAIAPALHVLGGKPVPAHTESG